MRRILEGIKRQVRRRPRLDDPGLDLSERQALVKATRLTSDLERNLALVETATGRPADLKLRRFVARGTPTALLYFEGLAEAREIDRVLNALQIEAAKLRPRGDILALARDRLLPSAEVTPARELATIIAKMALGGSALLFDGRDQALVVNTQGMTVRIPTEPEAESAIRGPRDGFVENLRVNMSLLRRRLRTADLWFERFEIGSLSRTTVVLGYIKGLASEELVAEARARLRRIDTDVVEDSGIIEEFIVDASFSIFPTVLRTERPDRALSALAAGRAVIMVDGSPTALIVPGQFASFLQAPDDYYEIFPIGSLVRLLRGVAGLMATFLPGTYVAVVNFHQELLPTNLLLRITSTREAVPFPLVMEIFFMEAVFELLREAGLRLPRAIGPAISIVGALVLGEAAIQASLVSPGAVIIVALTAIASFTTPIFSIGIAGRMARFALIGLGGVFGLFGIQFGALLLSIHVASLRSFGQPYFAPLAPLVAADLKDVPVRAPRWALDTRPKLLGGRAPRRQRPGQRPMVGRQPEEKEK